MDCIIRFIINCYGFVVGVSGLGTSHKHTFHVCLCYVSSKNQSLRDLCIINGLHLRLRFRVTGSTRHNVQLLRELLVQNSDCLYVGNAAFVYLGGCLSDCLCVCRFVLSVHPFVCLSLL